MWCLSINLIMALSKLFRPGRASPFVGVAAGLFDQRQNTARRANRKLREDLSRMNILFDSLVLIEQFLFSS
jgi:hypothetical protein